MLPLGQHPLPRHVVAHLSDPHLLAGGRLFGSVDTETNLRRALARLAHLPAPPHVLVFTGDLADVGDPAAYRRLRAIVEPAAAELGAHVVWTMGNHDDRTAYAAELYDAPGQTGYQDRVHDVDGLRIVALDTSVPGYHHGELRPAQLAWLAEVLATPAPAGTLLALHHPPIPAPLQRGAELLELHEQHRLAEVVAGTDVRAVLGGHFHHTSWSTFAGVPVSVASATCYTDDPAPADRFASGVDGHQAFTMLHLYGDCVVHTLVPVAPAAELWGMPAAVAAYLEGLSPADRHAAAAPADAPLWSGQLVLD